MGHLNIGAQSKMFARFLQRRPPPPPQIIMFENSRSAQANERANKPEPTRSIRSEATRAEIERIRRPATAPPPPPAATAKGAAQFVDWMIAAAARHRLCLRARAQESRAAKGKGLRRMNHLCERGDALTRLRRRNWPEKRYLGLICFIRAPAATIPSSALHPAALPPDEEVIILSGG